MRLGTRGSPLALWQARTVASALERATGVRCDIVVIRTSGDEAGTGQGPGGVTLDRQTADGSVETGDGRRQSADGSQQAADGSRETGDGRRQSADGGRETADARRQSGHGRRQTDEQATDSASPSADRRLGAPGFRLPSRGSRLSTPEASVKRLFVKELEEALVDGRIDAAVHSSKDMPTELQPGLMIGAALARADPRDALLLPASRPTQGDFGAIEGAIETALGVRPRIGTSSVRRVAQLRAVFPNALFTDVRGNLDTRLRKLDAGEYDALVLAAAGLRRLGHGDRISWAVPVDRSVPAPGQGIVAVEIRSDRSELAETLAHIDDASAADALAAERAVVRALGGGCQMPIGALAEIDGTDLRLIGVVIAPDGSHVVRQTGQGPRRDAAAIGVAVAEALLRSGAGAILDAVRSRQQPMPEAAP